MVRRIRVAAGSVVALDLIRGSGDYRESADLAGGWGMGVSDVPQHAGRLHCTGRPGSDLVVSKMRRPLLRPGTMLRWPLIERLARGDPRPIVSVVAPPGYGKTTLLSQWAERDGQSFAWVSVDEADNDPKVLLRYVAEALDAVEPVDGRVFDALASAASSVSGSVVPRLGSAFASMSSPVVLVLDDVHELHNRECRAALSVLADHLPGGSRMALAGRAQPPLRVARLRAEGRILEIGPGDLSLTAEEASSLLRNAGLTLTEEEVAELHRRTEGWPAGLYLAALYLREGGSLAGAAVSFGGDDRLVSEYVESEFLSRISRQQRVFLTRTAVLERMCGPLCDAVLEQRGSATVLADLQRSNLLLVPLDRRGEWYRYHHLFRDMLLAEMYRLEPGLMPVLYRRAAQWHEHNGAPGEAVGYRMKADDVDATARLAAALAFPTFMRGRAATAEGPGLGVFARQAEDLRAELSQARTSPALGASALTAAELRLLPLLSTHLSFPEIGAEMFLSRNTVKSHAHSIYRKLGISSRSQAVARSVELGLLEA